MSRKVCGVGVNDMQGKWCCSPNGGCKSLPYNEYEHRVYQLWYNMLNRSYNRNVSRVCDRWLIFSNFIRDLRFIPGYSLFISKLSSKSIFLDKDVKYFGNKMYDPSTVMFITNSESTRDRNNRCGNPILKGKHPKASSVRAININNPLDIKIYPSVRSTAKDGFTISAVSACCLGKRNKHKGYYWEYV